MTKIKESKKLLAKPYKDEIAEMILGFFGNPCWAHKIEK